MKAGGMVYVFTNAFQAEKTGTF